MIVQNTCHNDDAELEARANATLKPSNSQIALVTGSSLRNRNCDIVALLLYSEDPIIL